MGKQLELDGSHLLHIISHLYSKVNKSLILLLSFLKYLMPHRVGGINS